MQSISKPVLILRKFSFLPCSSWEAAFQMLSKLRPHEHEPPNRHLPFSVPAKAFVSASGSEERESPGCQVKSGLRPGMSSLRDGRLSHGSSLPGSSGPRVTANHSAARHPGLKYSHRPASHPPAGQQREGHFIAGTDHLGPAVHFGWQPSICKACQSGSRHAAGLSGSLPGGTSCSLPFQVPLLGWERHPQPAGTGRAVLSDATWLPSHLGFLSANCAS